MRRAAAALLVCGLGLGAAGALVGHHGHLAVEAVPMVHGLIALGAAFVLFAGAWAARALFERPEREDGR